MQWSKPMTNRRYREYLKSPQWKAKRKAVRERSGGICERCRKYLVDEVHHLTYARVFDEPLEDLQGLCKPCHGFLHQESGVDPLAESVYVKVTGRILECPINVKGTWKYRRIRASQLDQFKEDGYFNAFGKFLVPMSIFLDGDGNPVLDPSRWKPYLIASPYGRHWMAHGDGGRGRPIRADRAEIQRAIKRQEQRRIEEERRRQEFPSKFLGLQGKGLGTKEIRPLFRKYPRLVCLGQEYQILADSVRTTERSGIVVNVEFDWPSGGRLRVKIRDVATKLNDGVIMLDSERGILVWHDPRATEWHEIPGGTKYIGPMRGLGRDPAP